MKPKVGAKIRFTMPGAEGPAVLQAEITGIYEADYHGIAGQKYKPIPAGQTDGKVAYTVDLKTSLPNEAQYKSVSYAEVPKCWHWTWNEEDMPKKP